MAASVPPLADHLVDGRVAHRVGRRVVHRATSREAARHRDPEPVTPVAWGAALPVADVDTVTVRYGDMFGLLRDLRSMGSTNPLRGRLKHPTRRTVFLRAAEIYAERFADPDGRVRATFNFVWMSGWAPHESQQKPAKPGSATVSLAAALGPREG